MVPPRHRTSRLFPSWGPVVVAIAAVMTLAVGALAWSPRRPAGVDAWAVDALTTAPGSFPYRFASRLDDSMRLLGALAASLALALAAWVLLRRRDAVVASMAVAPATVISEQLLKLAGRRSLGLPDFTFPSGRVALATSLSLLLALLVRGAGARSSIRTAVAVLGATYVLGIAWARIATGQHLLTDVVGGMSMGVAVTLVILLTLTA
jgi:membrane-associated phospholipid phosphatase